MKYKNTRKEHESINFTGKGKYKNKTEYYNTLMVVCKSLNSGIEFKRPKYKKYNYKNVLMDTEYKLCSL